MSALAPGGVHHLAIAVRDLTATAAFYEQVLGLPVLRRWAATDGGAAPRSVWLDLGGGAFLALERTTGAAAPHDDQTPGLQMVALRIDGADRADWEKRFAAAEVSIVHRTPHTIYVRDPEGNRVGLSHWPHEASGRLSVGGSPELPLASPSVSPSASPSASDDRSKKA
jgi:glyoxylase I family protein